MSAASDAAGAGVASASVPAVHDSAGTGSTPPSVPADPPHRLACPVWDEEPDPEACDCVPVWVDDLAAVIPLSGVAGGCAACGRPGPWTVGSRDFCSDHVGPEWERLLRLGFNVVPQWRGVAA